MGNCTTKNSKVKSTNHQLRHQKTESDYSKEIAAYQRAVYYNEQPSRDFLTQSINITETKRRTSDAITSDTLTLFWTTHVNTLSDEEYSILALNFYLNVYHAIPAAKPLFVSMKNDMCTQSKIFFGVFGWLVSTINKDNAYRSAITKLSKLGKMHCKMGVTLDYYLKMGGAFHKTMAEYFKDEYSLRIRFCFNTLYEIVVNIMLGQDFSSKCKLQKKTMQLIVKINELEDCLNDAQSIEYLELFMKQKLCSELIMFYKDYIQFQSLSAADERNQYGKSIQTLYIDQGAERELNIGYKVKDEFYLKLKAADNNYCKTIYDDIYAETLELIRVSVFPLFRLQIMKLISSNACTPPDSSTTTVSANWNYVTDRLNHKTLF